jgi:hypothetical protein
VIGSRICLALAAATTLSALGATSAVAAKDDIDTHERGGAVVPCSLDGVNPAPHPEIFGNAAVAASFGFVKAKDGTWHVRPDCRH